MMRFFLTTVGVLLFAVAIGAFLGPVVAGVFAVLFVLYAFAN